VSSKAEKNRALVRRLFEAGVKTDLVALDKMLATDFVSHTKVLPGHKPDREGYKRTIFEYAATQEIQEPYQILIPQNTVKRLREPLPLLLASFSVILLIL